MSEGQTVTLSAANFGITDPDDSSFTYTVSSISGGYFQLSSNVGVAITSFTSADLTGGLVQFVDDGNEVAPSFSVTVNDGDSDSNTLAATITYAAANDTPVLDSANLTIGEGETVTLSDANFGITDPDDSSFTYTLSGISGGYFQLSSNVGVAITSFTSADLTGSLVQFVDDGNEVAPAFSVTVNDGDADSNTLAATITYTAANDTPVLDSAVLTVSEGQTVTLSAANFGITDPDDSSFTYTVSSISGGYFQLSSNVGVAITSFTSADLTGSLVQFVDDGNEVAPAFSVTVNDGDVDSNTLATTITYTAANDTPVIATNTGATVLEGSAGNGITTAMLNEGDPDDSGAGLTYTVTSIVSNGTLLLNGTALPDNDTFTQADIDAGLVTYDHNGSNTTSDSFAFSLADGGEDGAAATTGTFSITVTAVDDDTPTVVNQSLTLAEGATNVALTTSDLSSTDTDTNDATLIYTVGNVTNGTLTINGSAWASVTNDIFTQQDIIDGNVLYTHDGSNTTSDGFTYSVEDPAGNTLVGQSFSITVTAVDDNAPTQANNTGSTVVEGGTDTISNTELRYDDSEQPANSVTYTVTSGLANGQLELTGNPGVAVTSFTQAQIDASELVYVHDGSNTTSDSFNFSVADGQGNMLTGETFGMTITPFNVAPIAITDSFTVNEGGVQNLNLTVNDSDADDGLDLTSIAIVSNPSNGFIIVNTDGTVDYTHNGGETVSDSFSYSINDLSGATSNIVIVSLTINPVNDAPVASDITINATEDIVYTGTLPAATDPDNAVLTYVLDGDANQGTVLVNSDGSFSYTPDLNSNGADSFTYTVSDGNGGSNTYTVTVIVTAVNDAPSVISSALTTTTENTAYSYVITTSDPDNGTNLIISAGTLPTWLTLVDNGDGTATLFGTPTHAEVGDHSVVLQVSDGTLIGTQSFTVQVTGATNGPSTGDNGPGGDSGTTPGSGPDFDDPVTGEPGDPVVEIPSDETPVEEPVAEYLTLDDSNPEDDSMAVFPNPINENNPDIIFLTEENDTDARSEGHVDERDYIYFDNDLYKEIAAEKYLHFNGEAPEPNDIDGMDIADTNWDQLVNHKDYDRLREDINETFRSEQHAKAVKMKIVTASVTIFTVGIVSYLLRAGSLIAGLVSTLPLWRGLDPIVILAGKKKETKTKDEPSDSTEQPSEEFFDREAQ